MRAITASAILLIFYTFGCAGPDLSSKNHGIESEAQACQSPSPMEETSEASPSCRPESPLLQKVSNALGGFAAAMRDPTQ